MISDLYTKRKLFVIIMFLHLSPMIPVSMSLLTVCPTAVHARIAWYCFHVGSFLFFSPFRFPFHASYVFTMLPLGAFGLAFLTGITLLLLTRWQFHHVFSAQRIFLEVIPPQKNQQSIFATDQLFAMLHELAKTTPYETLLGIQKTLSLELVSTKEAGIRCMLSCLASEKDVLKQMIISFLPGCTITEIPDYLPDVATLQKSKFICTEFTLQHHFAYPLQSQSQLQQHDPFAFISGQMTTLAHEELMSLQYVLSPITRQGNPKLVKQIEAIKTSYRDGFDISPLLQEKQFVLFFLFFPFRFFSFFALLLFTFLGNYFSPQQTAYPFWLLTGEKRKLRQKLSPQKQEEQQAIYEKLEKELYGVTIRAIISMHSSKEAQKRMLGLQASFASFATTRQRLQKSVNFSYPFPVIARHKRLLQFVKHRYPIFSQNTVLSITELASMYHFPYFPSNKIEDLQTVLAKQLPSPLSYKQANPQFDLVFAQNTYHGQTHLIGQTGEERRRHTYILGATGMGKTTLLFTMIKQDILSGKGLCVIDPHGDLIADVLSVIPEKRITDTIVFRPDDTAFPLGLNILSLPNNLSEKDAEAIKSSIASSVFSIFTKLYPPKYLGPRMEQVLRSATLTALTLPSPTLFTVHRLLLDYQFRKKAIENLTNPALVLFWKEFHQMGSFQRAEVISPITNKLGKFLTDSRSAAILGQKQSTIDFSTLMDQGKILLCDVSKGKIGEDMSLLFGSLITAKLELAAQLRIRQKESTRRDFYLYIDEFQNFASSSFAHIMSESRKYHLNAILAHQTTAQIVDKDVLSIILANTGTVICFRTTSPLDEAFIRPYFAPTVLEYDIAKLPAYLFYCKIQALTPQDVFTATTLYEPVSPNIEKVERILRYASRTYGTPQAQVQQEINEAVFDVFSIDRKQQLEQEREKVNLAYGVGRESQSMNKPIEESV